MEENLVVIALALVLFTAWAWKILDYLWFRPRKLEKWLRDQGLKGNPYRLWHGDLKDMKRMNEQAQSKPINLHDDVLPHIIPFHHHIIQKYGFKIPIFTGKKSFVWHGTRARVNIVDPDITRDVLLNYRTFPKIAPSPLVRLFVAGLVLDEGDDWAKHRKILNPAFNMEKLKQMLPAMRASCSEILRKWEALMPAAGPLELDVSPYLATLSADVISRAAFGSSYEEGKRIFQLQADQAELAFRTILTNYIPGWRFVPTKTNKRMNEINHECRACIMEIINRRERKMKNGDTKYADDLLGVLLESNLQEIQENGNNAEAGINIEDVIEDCKLFYFAGQETTSNLLSWTMIMLGMHQNWQKRAREEVFQVFCNNKPDFEQLNHLKTLTMVTNEVLRLYPPVTMLGRKTHEKMKVGEMVLPPGVELLLHIALVHHDPEVWGKDANEFNPERFSEGVAKAAKRPGAFIPFSSGPRICIGLNFAIIEAKMAIAMILQHFSFELSPSYAHAPFPMLTLQPRFGAKMILHKI